MPWTRSIGKAGFKLQLEKEKAYPQLSVVTWPPPNIYKMTVSMEMELVEIGLTKKWGPTTYQWNNHFCMDITDEEILDEKLDNGATLECKVTFEGFYVGNWLNGRALDLEEQPEYIGAINGNTVQEIEYVMSRASKYDEIGDVTETLNILGKIKDVVKSVELTEERIKSIEQLLRDILTRLEKLEKDAGSSKQASWIATLRDGTQLALNLDDIISRASNWLTSC